MGWSATTPLWYTLTLDNQYLHTGYKKEGGYLNNVDSTPAQRFLIEKNNKAKRGQSKSDHMREWVKNRVERTQELMEKLEKDPNTMTAPDGVLAGARKNLFLRCMN